MLVKTILNKIEKFKSFVYEKTYFEIMDGEESLIVELSPRKNSRGTCCTCGKYCSTYDTQFIRDYEYVILPQRSGLAIMSTDSLIQTQVVLGNQ